MNLPYAEEVGHYWETSKQSGDTWMDKTKKLVVQASGEVLAEGFGSSGGHAAYMMAFKIGGDQFKVVWPVLPSRSGKVASSRRQAATMLYHDIKAKLMAATVLGNRVAFFSYLVLPDGRSAAELATPELAQAFPPLLGRG